MSVPSNVPAPPPRPTPPPSYGTPQQQAPATAQPAPVATVNPFAGIPVRDYVVDAVSALLLIISIFMVWTYPGSNGKLVQASSNIAVLLITILSILSLGLTYLWRAGAFGTSWNYRKMQDLRMAANIPYVVLFLVYLVMVLVQGGVRELSGGLGQAAAFGLAGALLAAQPRKAELGAQTEDTGRDRRWIFILLGVGALAVLVGFIQLIKMLVGISGTGSWFLLSTISSGLLVLYPMVELGRRIYTRHEPARLVAVGLGLAGVFLALVSLGEGMPANASLFGNQFVFSAFMWLPFGAVAAAPSIARMMQPMDPRNKWLQSNQLLLNMTLVLAAVSILSTIGTLIAMRDYSTGAVTAQLVMTLLFSVILGVGALIAKQSFASNPAQAYLLTSAYAGIVFVVFLVVVIMAASNDYGTGWMAGLLVLITFVVPAALLGMLWAPASTRAEYKALKGSPQANRGFSFEGAPGQAPAQPVPNAFQASGDQLLAEAANPATSGARLRELALNHPHTQDAIIANPGTYAELRDWLVQMRPSRQAQEPVPVEPVAAFVAPVAVDAVDPLLAEASNPATSAARLHELAGAHPHLHEAILENPAAYDGLRDWIIAQRPVQSAAIEDEQVFESAGIAPQETPEQTSSEAPAEEPLPVAEEPVAEPFAPVADIAGDADAEPTAEDSVVEEEPLLAEEPVLAEEPIVAEEPVLAEEPIVAEEPVLVEPIIDEPIVAEPVIEVLAPEDDNMEIQTPAETSPEELTPDDSAAETAAVDPADVESAPEFSEIIGDDDAATVLRADVVPTPVVDPLLDEASNPETPAARLQELAGTHPHLHEAILGNPAAYDGLRAWIIAQRPARVEPAEAVFEASAEPVQAEAVVADQAAESAEETLAGFEADDAITMLRGAAHAAPSADPLVEEASNPGTAPARLQELAGAHPHLHEAILANPATYAGLRDWILSQQPGQQVAAVDPLVQEASNPGTPPARLQELAGAYPHLHEAILANPGTYAGLRDWILSQQPGQQVAAVDPLVQEASNPGTPPARLQELAGAYPHLHEAILANPGTYDGLRQWINAQAPAVEGTDPLTAEASNPATSPARLQELAATHQELHAVIAANPATYPQLLQWLGQINAPGVAEALSRR